MSGGADLAAETGCWLWQDDCSGGGKIFVGGLKFAQVVWWCFRGHKWSDIEAGYGSAVDGGQAASD